MTIDKRGEWWKGTSIVDVDEYLLNYEAGGHAPDRFVHPRCACGATAFRLRADALEGVVERICASCAAEKVMLDGEEFVEDANLEESACACGHAIFDVSVAFAHRTEASVKWISVGSRCRRCGVLGCVADWKIDYEPTAHLYESG